uniref:Uncharacterized protein n=1 Tax=Vespula pensylvanica TaxID=30213 RepID=A0A834PFF0_VESPE|nr:hypothetical protein H0235_000916 [Vespula pensylvanica]
MRRLTSGWFAGDHPEGSPFISNSSQLYRHAVIANPIRPVRRIDAGHPLETSYTAISPFAGRQRRAKEGSRMNGKAFPSRETAGA